ncbi:MAG: ABC transporter substrate-binding protein [Planctomycetota bacterium]
MPRPIHYRLASRLAAAVLLATAAAFAHAKPVDVQPAADGQGFTITDTRGRVHAFDAPVDRVAACSTFALETLMAIDAPPVARFHVPPVYPAEAEAIPVVARSHGTGPDVEQLVAANADVILLHDVFHAFADDVQAATRTLVVLHRVDSIDDIRQHAAMIGTLVGREDAAADMVADIDATLGWVDSVPAPDHAPRAVSLFGTNDAWFAHRRNAFMGDLLDRLGAVNVAAEREAHSTYRSLAPVDVEQLIQLDPEVVFIVPYGGADESVVENLINHPAFGALSAVRNGRVHVLDGPIYFSHVGPRVGEAVRTLHAHLYPDADAPASASAADAARP